MQFGDVAMAARAHDDAIVVAVAQGRGALRLRRRIADVIDLVEDADARHVLRADLRQHLVGHRELPLEARIAGVPLRCRPCGPASLAISRSRGAR